MITRVVCMTDPLDTSKGTFNVSLASQLTGVTKIKLLNACVPSVNYNVEDGYCDQITIRVGVETITFTLAAGYYNYLELFAAIEQLLNGHWPSANFLFAYDSKRFTAILGSNMVLSILDGPRSCAYLLGFAVLPSYTKTIHLGEAAVRLNTQKWIMLAIDIPGLTVLQAPLINSTGTWLLPIYSGPTEISYLNSMDLAGQDVDLSPGINISKFTLQLKRLDCNREYSLAADTAFLLEFEHRG